MNHLSSAPLDLVVKGEHELAKAMGMGANKVKKTMKALQHMRFDKKLGKYVVKEGRKAGKLDMRVVMDRELSVSCHLLAELAPTSRRATTTSGTADTGATICCTGVEILPKLGIQKSDLLRTRVDLYVADKRKLTILGVIPVIITVGGNVSGRVMQTRELLYVVKDLKCTFDSKDALEALALGVINKWELMAAVLANSMPIRCKIVNT